MHVHTPGRATTIRTLNPGTLFIARAHDGMGLYLAIEPRRNQGLPDAITLIPGHHMLSGNPALKGSRVFGEHTIFALDNAAISFDVNLKNINTNQQKWPENNKMIYAIGGKVLYTLQCRRLRDRHSKY